MGREIVGEEENGAETVAGRAHARIFQLMFVVCGEALYDLFGARNGGSADMAFDGRMGGSPFNVARGMARLGADVALFTGVSTDMLGENIAVTLRDEGVDTRYLLRSERQTTLSVVAVDDAGSPSYTFYGVGSSDCSIGVDDLPVLGSDVTGLHFGSYSIAVEPVATAMAALAKREEHRFISFDPNVRPTVEPNMDIWRSRVDAMRRLANVVKVSDEDLAALYPGETPENRLTQWAADGPALTVLTRGGGDVLALRGSDMIRVSPPAITVVDTVGAGDAFQASLLATICGHSNPCEWLRSAPANALHHAIGDATHAAAMVCRQRGADLPRTDDIRARAISS